MKLFIDNTTLLKEEKLIPVLYPFFGMPDWSRYYDAKFNKKAFEDYYYKGSENLQLTTLEECDCIIFPYDYSQAFNNNKYKGEINYYADLNAKSNKPILIFWNQDYEFQQQFLSHFNNYYLFHTSFFKSKADKRVHVHPYFIEDTFKQDIIQNDFSKDDTPSVSFCGFAPPLGIPLSKYYFKELVKFWIYRLKLHKYLKVTIKQAARVYAIKRLIRSQKIKTNFIIRKWSGFDDKQGMFIGHNDAYYSLMRKEYFDNINSADYVLCARGNGNFSIRFYETLCHGRIPIIINTDMKLPFEECINWNKHAVIVQENDIKNIEQRILDFHFFNEKILENIKIKNRQIWKEYFTAEEFFAKIEMLCL